MQDIGIVLALLDTAAVVATAFGVCWIGSKLKRENK